LSIYDKFRTIENNKYAVIITKVFVDNMLRYIKVVIIESCDEIILKTSDDDLN